MCDLDHLLKNNQAWAERTQEKHPEFFSKLAAQ